MLVACGHRAIPALRRFLVQGKPSGIFVPRQRAVRALAEIGAKAVLLEYLVSDVRSPDPVAAHGEEAVKNSAARALAAWRTDDVYQTLRTMLQRKKLLGVIETLGEFGRPEAVPEIIAELEDDFCRSTAEEALLKIGELAHAALISAARSPDPSGAEERPASQQRRRRVLRILESLELTAHDWRQLAALLHDPDAEIAARAGAIALRVGDRRSRELAAVGLVQALATPDWLLRGEIQTWLEDHLEICLPAVRQEIHRRMAEPRLLQVKDDVLRLLLAIQPTGRKQAR